MDFSMALQVEKQTKYWRSVLKCSVSVTKFIADLLHQLAFDEIVDDVASWKACQVNMTK